VDAGNQLHHTAGGVYLSFCSYDLADPFDGLAAVLCFQGYVGLHVCREVAVPQWGEI
jgi:hypothetical protein